MYNYEYAPQGYETNYEFNPELESGFETENFEEEYGNEYEMNPEFEQEQNYEDENQYEDEWRGVVRDHTRTPSGARRSVVVPTRSGARSYPRSSYRPAGYQKYGSYNRSRYPYRNQRPSWFNRNYHNRPWRSYGWRNRYPGSWASNIGVTNYNQDQYPVGPDMNGQPASGGSSYILDSIRNLSQQIASTNANLAAMQQSMAGANTGAPPPGDNSMTQGANPTGGGQPAPAGELEMENYGYGMGNESENYEQAMGNETMGYEDQNNEMMEMELATELLATSNEMELDHFLGGLVGGGLKNLFKAVVKKALPVAGAAAGAFFGGPLGAKVGEKIGSAASNVFELELEGLSNEDREYEVARAIVRLAGDAVRELEETPSSGDPNQDARNALIQSALRNAPGLLVKRRRNHHNNDYGQGGHWRRRGNKIVIENAF